MINVKKIVTLLFISILSIVDISSQSKVGHIDTQKLISSMPEMTIVQAELEKLLKKYSAEYQNMEKTKLMH